MFIFAFRIARDDSISDDEELVGFEEIGMVADGLDESVPIREEEQGMEAGAVLEGTVNWCNPHLQSRSR